jgi:hypothetical protein
VALADLTSQESTFNVNEEIKKRRGATKARKNLAEKKANAVKRAKTAAKS